MPNTHKRKAQNAISSSANKISVVAKVNKN